MSLQVLPQLGSTGSQIGRGMAQGLSEQIPKEIATYRLSSGLKKLGEKDLSKNNQLQNIGEIAGIPGMTPELMQLALQQIQKQNFLQQGQGGIPNQHGIAAQQRQPGIPNQQMAPGQSLSEQIQPKTTEAGLASPSQIAEYKKNILQEPSYQQIKSLADQYIVQGLTQDPNQALVFAKNEIAQNRAAQQEKINQFRKTADERLKLSLQGGGFGDYKDVAGEIQKSLIDQGEYLMNEGATPQQAADQIDQIALDLGKTANKLKDTGSWANMFRKSSTKTNELRSQKRDFEKYGYGELFDDMAAAQLGITSLQAAHILDPIKNQVIKGEIENLKKYPSRFDKKMKDSELDKIVRNIKPQDNLYDIEYLLRDKGYDVNQFKKRVEALSDERFIALSPQQKRQQQRAVSSSFLGDILYQSF